MTFSHRKGRKAAAVHRKEMQASRPITALVSLFYSSLYTSCSKQIMLHCRDS